MVILKYKSNASSYIRNSFVQWVHVRRQYSGKELEVCRTDFTVWKQKLARIYYRKKNLDRPWEKDSEWLLKYDTVSAMRSAWNELDEQARRVQWPSVMISAMRQNPQRAHIVLEATLSPQTPGYAIHDVLVFISQTQFLASARDSQEKILKSEEMMRLLRKIITELPKAHILFPQRVFGLCAKALATDQALELYNLLRESDFPLELNTLCQFASKFARSTTRKNVAFEILRGLPEGGVDFNNARESSIITSLLHCTASQNLGEEMQADFDAKEALLYFVGRGFSINVITATAFLNTLCRSGEAEEAVRLAWLFSESGVKLDKKAWRIAFRGAKSTLKVDYIARGLDLANKASVPFVDVLNNALHSIYALSESERREKGSRHKPGPPIFIPMLRIYAKVFELQPLQWWLSDTIPLLLAENDAGPREEQRQHLLPQLQEEGKVQQEELTLEEQKLQKQQQQQQQQQQTQPQPQLQQQKQGISHEGSPGATRRRWGVESTIIPFIDKTFSDFRPTTKLQPSLTTIAIMLRAYIRSLQNPYDLTTCYAFFKARLEEQSRDVSLPSASRLVMDQASLIHDTFILSMTDHRDLSRSALEVFGDMLKDHKRVTGSHANQNDDHNDSSDTGTAEDHKSGNKKRSDKISASKKSPVIPIHPSPSVMTFTILLRGLMKSHSYFLVDHFLEVMRELGIHPNQVTWNAIVRGHAIRQNVRRTVIAMQDMEAAGHKPDVYTFKAFQVLKEQDKALKLMEKMIQMNAREAGVGADDL
ncbi:hypothetical protein E4U60_002522 [Claviceps pazoutovae]|uniref:Pentatricopeptide repeat protein n=1 Tax=Claviceps pazoutovae TaxID=1649127 RepID=A0A9P7MBF3_9HYPO|nr:hypothetical protein E4U60_002522 [Claviceps pazoutovae]